MKLWSTLSPSGATNVSLYCDLQGEVNSVTRDVQSNSDLYWLVNISDLTL